MTDSEDYGNSPVQAIEHEIATATEPDPTLAEPGLHALGGTPGLRIRLDQPQARSDSADRTPRSVGIALGEEAMQPLEIGDRPRGPDQRAVSSGGGDAASPASSRASHRSTASAEAWQPDAW